MMRRGMKKDCYLSARCTVGEKQQIERNINKSGLSKSEYVVGCCIAAKERNSEKLKRTLILRVASFVM